MTVPRSFDLETFMLDRSSPQTRLQMQSRGTVVPDW
jgi:hypothetical protein